MDMEKKSPLRDVMNSTMEKVREMMAANNIVGAPITTPDGVTLIPISRGSFGFGSGGGDYGKPGQNNFGGGGGAGFQLLGLALRRGQAGGRSLPCRLRRRGADPGGGGGVLQAGHGGVNDVAALAAGSGLFL